MIKLLTLLSLIFVSFCQFDAEFAKHLFYLNAATYCRPNKVKDWSCKPCTESKINLQHVQPFFNSTGDILGIIGVSTTPRALILVFRGSNPRLWKNWLIDIDFIKAPHKICKNGCQIHRGFYNAYVQIESAVIKTVKEYKQKYEIVHVILVGHSLGGALATHAAISLTNQGMEVERLYTYGSPRVGDVKFSQWFEQYIQTKHKYRITHGRDPVPHLPPLSFGFNHVPHEIFQKATIKEQYVVCNDSGTKEDPKCSNKFLVDGNVMHHGNYCGVNFLELVAACF